MSETEGVPPVRPGDVALMNSMLATLEALLGPRDGSDSQEETKYEKLLRRYLEDEEDAKTSSPDAVRGTEIKGQLAPRMVSWNEKSETRSKTLAEHMSLVEFVVLTYGYKNRLKLLHGDVSTANLFWYFNKKGRLVSVLNDFDIHNPDDFEVLENGNVASSFSYKEQEKQASTSHKKRFVPRPSLAEFYRPPSIP